MTSVDAVSHLGHVGEQSFTDATRRGPPMPSEKGYFALSWKELRE
jgi:hypothetical protein